MRKLFLLCVLFLAVTSYASAAYPKLRTGTYLLSGGNTKWADSGYRGEVIIEPQGENYRLIWRIGSAQSQYGVGILYDDILSVAFCDGSNTNWGVVSYRLVADGELQGRWTSYTGTSQKPEYLIWKGY
jgi:hypothetical protein